MELDTSTAKEKRKPWPTSLCLRCRWIHLKGTWVTTLLHPYHYYPLPPPDSWNIKSCHFCRLCFESLTTDQRSLSVHFAIKTSDSLTWDLTSRRLLPREIVGQEKIIQLVTRQPPSADYANLLAPSKCILSNNPVSAMIQFDLISAWLYNPHVREVQHTTENVQSNSSDGPGWLTVIDCRSRVLAPLPPGERYVTLSYVWGSQATAETPINASKLPSVLPQTIEDAIRVTTLLGLKFLWIDRYCIPQQDPHARLEQIRRMDRIYSYSFVTLVACVGYDPHHGLAGVSYPRATNPSSHQYQLIPTKGEITSSVWASRGWTFQEALLSPRQLYFTDRQLVFQGQNAAASELTYGSQIPFDPDLDYVFPSGLWTADTRQVYWCIQEYSNRTLSYPEDVLKAVYGIFAVFERNMGIRHLWGLPFAHEDDFPSVAKSFCWYELNLEKHGRPVARRKGFPTWSWTSSPDPVVFRDVYTRNSIQVEGVELLNGDMLIWKDYGTRYQSITYEDPRLSPIIHVNASHTTPMRVRKLKGYGIHSEMIASIAQENGNFTSRKFDVVLDSQEMPLEVTDVLVGIHLNPPSVGNEYKISLLLVRDQGDHWERVGLAWKNTEDNYRWPMTPRKFRLG